jgi:hypothetical protein
MFVGHYGVAFAAKKADASIPLWVLFLAVQGLDVIWAPLVLLGIERRRAVSCASYRGSQLSSPTACSPLRSGGSRAARSHD